MPRGLQHVALPALGAGGGRHLPLPPPAVLQETSRHLDPHARVLLGLHLRTHPANHEEDRRHRHQRRNVQIQGGVQQVS